MGILSYSMRIVIYEFFSTFSHNSWPFIGAPYLHASTSGSNPKRSYSEMEAETPSESSSESESESSSHSESISESESRSELESSSESSESMLSVDADFNVDHKKIKNLIHILSQPYIKHLREQGAFNFEAEASLSSKKRRGNFLYVPEYHKFFRFLVGSDHSNLK